MENDSVTTELYFYHDEEFDDYNWDFIKTLDYKQANNLKKNFINKYHTCPSILEKKKQMETFVKKSLNGHRLLRMYFKQTNFTKRKYTFYLQINNILCPGGFQYNTCACRNVLVWNHLILKKYQRKREILSMLEARLDRLYDIECEREDTRDLYLDE